MDIVPYFRNARGLNNQDPPTRIALDPTTGSTDLSIASNIVIDKTGAISRRPGFTKLLSGNFHSLFCDGGLSYICKDTSLYQLTFNGSSYSLVGIRSGMTGLPLQYTTAGQHVYYGNAHEKGRLTGADSKVWVPGPYYGPKTTRVFGDIPTVEGLAYYAGRTFIISDNVLYWSEPFRPDLIDRTKSFISFKSSILMVAAVQEGLFVSTANRTYFLRGPDVEKFQQECVCTFPALKSTAPTDFVEGITLGLVNPGLCRIWTSTQGVILGLPTGQVLNLNGKAISYPLNGPSATTGVVSENYYIHNTGPITYCMNLRTHATTQFLNYDFNSMARVGSAILGATSTGLYSLMDASDSDDGIPIPAEGQFKTWDFSVPNTKRIRHAYIGYEAEEALIFTASADTDQPSEYVIEPKKTGLQGTDITLPSSPQGRYWTFGIKNSNGNQFRLEAIDILPIVRNAAIT